METWLSELEMAWNEEPILNDHPIDEMNTLGEELALVLGEDFYSIDGQNTITSIFDNNSNSQNTQINFSDTSPVNQNVDKHDDKNNKDGTYYNPKPIDEPKIIVEIQQSPQNENNLSDDENGVKEGSDDQQGTKCGKRKRRDPGQVQDHIMAERKRRQTLSQRFIALSALVPGLKKVDKTSILEEAIKHLKQMKERVETLEKAASKQIVRPKTVVKRTQLVVDNDTESDSSIDNPNCIIDDTCDDNQSRIIPDIEVKVSHKTMVVRICCARRTGILGTVCKEVEDCRLSILNCSAIAFGSSAVDITVVAEMEAAKGYDKKLKNLIKNLNSTLRM